MKILCVHGVGHQEAGDWQRQWGSAIKAALPNSDVELGFVRYDQHFANPPTGTEYTEALARLLASEVTHGLGDRLDFSKRRGFGQLGESVTWTAGMIAHWVSDEMLRLNVRTDFLSQVAAFGPDVIVAHSLGSLITYDAIASTPRVGRGIALITLGSQIGCPAVRDVFGGRLVYPTSLKHWNHLFNPHDHVFTASLAKLIAQVDEVVVPFDIPNDLLNHDATRYISDRAVQFAVWNPLENGDQRPRSRELLQSAIEDIDNGLAAKKLRKPGQPNKKALLIGINEYPDPENRLSGCINDVFLMSALLQECGFDPEDIRVVLDERATAKGILQRLDWLLSGTSSNDQRVLFYSGHGAQLRAYGALGEPDHTNECLCPWDFDWTPERAITDKQFQELYVQLPYDCRFFAFFDCCHSGGLTRGAATKIRGLTPPDDIRHRGLRWDPNDRCWVARDFVEKSNAKGAKATLHRLGCAQGIRSHTSERQKEERRKTYGHQGPYMPVILYACQENELASEYLHGVISYGAYTYGLDIELRRAHEAGEELSFDTLMKRVRDRLKRLGYDQRPAINGPKAQLSLQVPWSRQS